MRQSCTILALVLAIVCMLNPTGAMAAQNPDITNGGVYILRNVGSNKNVNPDYGLDYNNINVYQWTADGSVEQTYRVVYDAGQDAYRFYSMSSVNGRYRVLDIVKSGGVVASGCNVAIYAPVDPVAQFFKIESLGSGKFKIVPKSNTNVALTAYGALNGSPSGTTSTSAGNVLVSTYTGSTNQQWYLDTAPSNNESYYAGMNWSFPVPSNKVITSNYGYRTMSGATSFHAGIDVGAPSQTPIYSANNGTVIRKDFEPSTTNGRGHFILVRSNTENVYGTSTKISLSYLHMYEASSLIAGSSVYSGTTLIGKVGTTGASTGNHLHFGVTSNGTEYGNTKATTLNPFFFYPQIPADGYTIYY